MQVLRAGCFHPLRSFLNDLAMVFPTSQKKQGRSMFCKATGLFLSKTMPLIFIILVAGFLLLYLLRKRKQSAYLIKNPKILLLQLGHTTDKALETDTKIYSGFYTNVTVRTVDTIKELRDFIALNSFHLVHFLVDIDAAGNVFDSSGNLIGLKELASLVHSRDARYIMYIMFAKDNPNGYSGPSAKGLDIQANVVMTLDRKGNNFADFFTNIFSRVSKGNTLPMVWHKISPQIPNRDTAKDPEVFALMAASSVVLMGDK
jgi:hypothetical protein